MTTKAVKPEIALAAVHPVHAGEFQRMYPDTPVLLSRALPREDVIYQFENTAEGLAMFVDLVTGLLALQKSACEA